ncbi:hypothetical protein MFIFM68171_09517 [Madurella fahalii]|uniref:Uncharacterized protein n=1 Tax=Madurella fahalii TaxID=1157608 RepID=A0ABQ0GNF7_9PEZI
MFEDASGHPGAHRHGHGGALASDYPTYYELAGDDVAYTSNSLATTEPAINLSFLTASNQFSSVRSLSNAPSSFLGRHNLFAHPDHFQVGGLEPGYADGECWMLPDLSQNQVPDSSLSGFMKGPYNFPDSPADPPTVSVNSDSDGGMQLAYPTSHSQLPEGVRALENEMLVGLRRAGWGYKDIAAEMRKKFGGAYTTNALIKRFHRIQTEDLKLLSTAVKNVMPHIMACINAELAGMDLSGLSEADRQALTGVLEEMADGIPKWVQSRFIKKCKAATVPVSNPTSQG